MVTRKIDRVKKRDGRIVPYDESKLSEAIYKAARTAGSDNRFLAGDLAGVVTLYLERYHQKEIPTSHEIRDMVEKILYETGHPEIARSYIVHRENRDRQSPSVPQGMPEGTLFPGESVLVDAATRDEVSPWSRERIADALVKEVALSPEIAGEVAASVEQRIFAAKLSRVSTHFIRELVASELFERGYSAKLGKQSTVGLPKYDLKRLISHAESSGPAGAEVDPGLDPERLCLTIGETTMKQFALQELFDVSVANAHMEGRIHIHNLEHPLKLYWLAPSIEYLRNHGIHIAGLPAASAVADSPRTLTSQLALLFNHARKFFSEAIEYPHVNVFYAPLLKNSDRSGIETEAVHLLLALNQLSYSAGSGRPVPLLGMDLGVPRYLSSYARPSEDGGAAEGLERTIFDFTREILNGWKASPSRTRWGAPQEKCLMVNGSTFHDERTTELLKEACVLASSVPPVLFVFDRGECPPFRVSRYHLAQPAQAERPEEEWFCMAQAVTLNLPQAFYRAETGGTDFYAELDRTITLAVEAHVAKREILKRFVNRATGTFGEQLGWIAHGNGALKFDQFRYALGIAGLEEAVTLMSGKGMAEDENAVRVAQRIVAYIYMRVREEEAKHRIRISLEDIGQDEAVARLGRIDVQMYPRARSLWMNQEQGRAYSAGFHLPVGSLALPEKIMDLEGRFHTLFASGRVCLNIHRGAGMSPQDIFSLVRRAFWDTHISQVLFQ